MQAFSETFFQLSYRTLKHALERKIKILLSLGFIVILFVFANEPEGTNPQDARTVSSGILHKTIREVMRIAVASEGLDVSCHFSCCTNFNYYKIENGEMVDSRNLPSQGHLCGSQANFLRQIDVKVLICGNISEKDAQSMANAGITVVPGASGRAFDATEAYLKGKLDSVPIG